MEAENKGQISTGLVVIIVAVIAIIAVFFLLGNDSSNESDTGVVQQDEQSLDDKTLSEQISEGASTDNPASDVPQANVFETETNPFKSDGFKNPFE